MIAMSRRCCGEQENDGKRETYQEAIAVNQVKGDGGSDQSGSSGDGEKKESTFRRQNPLDLLVN